MENKTKKTTTFSAMDIIFTFGRTVPLSLSVCQSGLTRLIGNLCRSLC